MPVLRDWDIRPDVDMVLRGQGADPSGVRSRRPSAVAIAEEAIATGTSLLQPAVAWDRFPVEGLRHQQLRLEDGRHLTGPLVAEHLAAAQEVTVAVCTIGPALEEMSAKCFGEDPAMGVALDAFGSAAVDMLATAMCQIVDEEATAKGLKTSVPLSPGLVGWPLGAGQKQLFALVDGAAAGVSLTKDSLMLPQKSTSLVIGTGEDVLHSGETCDYCSMATTCLFRDNTHHGAHPGAAGS